MITWKAGLPSQVVRTETDSIVTVEPSKRVSRASAGAEVDPGAVRSPIRRSRSGMDVVSTKSVIGLPSMAAADGAPRNRTVVGLT
jgi:hypothetical protein